MKSSDAESHRLRDFAKEKVTFKQALLVAVAAGLGYGFDAYAVNIYSLVLPAIKDTLHVSLSALGTIGSIFLVGYTIGTIGFGIAADRWGRKDTLGVSILVYGASTALGGLTTNVPVFTALRFLTGVGGAGELAVGAPYTAEMWPARHRAVGTGGIIFSLYSAGYILAAGTALLVVPRWGWQWAFILAIVPSLALFLIRRRLRESTRYTVAKLEAKAKGNKRAKVSIWRVPGAKKRIVIGWLIYTANAVGYWGMTVFLTTFMVQKFHVSAAGAIKYAMLFYVVQFLFCYVGTWLADALGRKPSAILGAVIMMGATALGATATGLSSYLVFGGLSIAMLGWLWGVGDTYIAELFPTSLRGTGFGIAVGGGRVVSIAAPFVVGWAISVYGPTVPYLAFTGLWVLTIIGYLMGPETARKELEEISIDVAGGTASTQLVRKETLES
ncbi:MFS transporter [Amycolatopsis alkalitolerans]|uniref:MFS transporter n=1 Tax=Amycolatopsis alkalitolerans TaxID=2547244 RepID=A0A5C4M0E3_9PSEU|nr:MFS transporter [Amycolatopsis alkalitolerans]TNC25113.1 MFS transporter [Amycolatopsis alkalitolerans]